MTTWQSNDDLRHDGGAEVADFVEAPQHVEEDEREEQEETDGFDDKVANGREQYAEGREATDRDTPARSTEGDDDRRRGPDSSSPLPSFGRYGGPQGRSAALQGADDDPSKDSH